MTHLAIFFTICLFTPGSSNHSESEALGLVYELILIEGEDKEELYQRIEASENPLLIAGLLAYESGLLTLSGHHPAFYGQRVEVDGSYQFPLLDAVTEQPLYDPHGQALLSSSLDKIYKAPRSERKRIRRLIDRLTFFAHDPKQRHAAIIRAGNRADSAQRSVLARLLSQVRDDADRYELQVALARIDLIHGEREEKLAALGVLRELAPLGVNGSLDRAEEDYASDVELVTVIAEVRQMIESKEKKINFIHHSFAGLSLASILILMALGLAIIFGQMGVINMAHGEFMMLGAFSAYIVAMFFKNFLPTAFDWYWLVALPMTFLLPALMGWFCEITVIRRLYGRPLDSLLATCGISLILIQAVRVLFGDNVAIPSPTWLIGGWQISRDLVLPWNRLLIIFFCIMTVCIVYFVIHRLRFGLQSRATTEQRDMAGVCGIDTQYIDGLTFSFGTGLAGLAGAALVLFDKLNPQMGQGYIVESFMVVVSGGVGQLHGTLLTGCGLGFLTKYLEPSLQAVYGKVLVLLIVFVIMCFRPAGFFPDKRRANHA